ncbi:perlucin-like protein [Ostrea edulis]|uniref:perlucin-like protein n=1 Tax=Ostrea edulis TaxID=37623 RepID=UPI0024AEF948|nr:perlucin-like protein [Ostrea edulis]
MWTYLFVLLFLEGTCGVSVNRSSLGSETRCSNGYTRFEDSCYLLNNEVASWIEAYQICLTFNACLVEVKSSQEYTFLQGYLNEHGQSKGKSIATFLSRSSYGNSNNMRYNSFPGYWMGGNSMETPGNWVWMKSKEKVDFSIIGNPFINGTGSGCLYFDSVNFHETRTKECHTKMYSVCEKAPTME